MKRDAIVVSRSDNVATALRNLAGGERAEFEGGVVELKNEIRFGHKFAISEIKSGSEIKKYGETIGRAISGIAAGEHVHTHNVESLRGRGDKA